VTIDSSRTSGSVLPRQARSAAAAAHVMTSNGCYPR
jgi:hypothetical protein